MKIGIIGAGSVGGVVGAAWARAGHEVLFASSDPASDKMKALVAAAGERAVAGAAADAAGFGDILLLATPWGKTKDIVKALPTLEGKVLIDATNPIAADFSDLEAHARSGGERVAKWAKGARVVKTLNQIGANLMDAPRIELGRPVMFVAGDDAEAKATAIELVSTLGFYAEDCGGLAMARHLESLAWIWINRALKQSRGRNFAFVLSDAEPAGD